jgi:glycosyltransferase involved in cell wall biosynthesis
LTAVFEYLKKTTPDQSIQLDIYGPIDGPSFWKDCQRVMRTLPKHVTANYRGVLNHSQVNETLSQHHFLILPTLGESFGHAIVEALSAGCPVIISDRTPWKNLVSQKVGWDIPLEESEKFAQVIRYCASMDQGEYDSWSKSAFDYAHHFLNDPAIIRQSRKLFDGISEKILLINQAFFPDVMATAQYLTDVAVALAERGEDVHVLAARRGYAPPYPVYSPKEIYRGITINRVRGMFFGRKNKLTRMLDACAINLAFGWHLLWQTKFDRVIAMTNPPLVAWFGLVFAKLRRAEFIYWVMDINPDQAIEAGWIRRGSLVANFFEAILRLILKGSDKVIVLDHYMKQRIILKGVSPEKIKVVPLWALTEGFIGRELEVNPFREAHGLNNKFIVMYSGNLSLCHPIDTILRAALDLKNDHSIMFVFVGAGERLREVLDFKQKHSLENIISLPYQDRSVLDYSLDAANLHVITMGTNYVGILHPSKIYGVLMTKRPFIFIGPVQSSIGDIIREKKVGCQINHGDVAGFIGILNQVKKQGPCRTNNFIESAEYNVKSVLREITVNLSNSLTELDLELVTRTETGEGNR